MCSYAQCPCCHEYHNLHTHQCYLQPVTEKEKKQRKRKRYAAAGLTSLRANDPEMDDDDEQENPRPLSVYFNIEARQDHGEHKANLLCTEREHWEASFVFEGENCVEDFLD